MELFFKGNQELLNQNPLALFCSRAIPLDIYYPAIKLVSNLMESSITLAGAWQSTIEKKSLKSRKSGSLSNIIYFLGKGIDTFCLPIHLKSDYHCGKILIISKWKTEKRLDRIKAARRNDFIIDTIGRILFLCIRPGGQTEELFKKSVSSGKEVFLINHAFNDQWMVPGVEMISENDHGVLL